MLRCAECLKVIQPWALERRDGKAFCPHCKVRLCRVCGCTDERTCRPPCAWQDAAPEVCSSHAFESMSHGLPSRGEQAW